MVYGLSGWKITQHFGDAGYKYETYVNGRGDNVFINEKTNGTFIVRLPNGDLSKTHKHKTFRSLDRARTFAIEFMRKG